MSNSINNKKINECKDILLNININPASTIEYKINEEIKTVTLEWIIQSYMQASSETQNMFLSSLKKIAEGANQLALKEYFENMGKLIFMASLSQKDIAREIK